MGDARTDLTISLMASSNAWRIYSARQMDSRFEAFAKKIFQRDNHQCQFCGFQAKQHQEIANLDGNYLNNKPDNLVTACCFCSQCFFIESVGVGGYGGGTLIFLPELTQSELNSLCHVLFCSITNDTGYKTSAQTIYASFKGRSQAVEAKYGEGTSDPSIMGRLLIDSGVSSDGMTAMLTGIRLLPSRAKFRKQIEDWAASALNELVGA